MTFKILRGLSHKHLLLFQDLTF